MREMRGDVLVYESLLNIYYDEKAKRYLDQKTIEIINCFVECCKAKDIVDNTNISEIMEIVYNPNSKLSKSEIKETLSLSGSSLYRFRIKLVYSLQKYISGKIS